MEIKNGFLVGFAPKAMVEGLESSNSRIVRGISPKDADFAIGYITQGSIPLAFALGVIKGTNLPGLFFATADTVHPYLNKQLEKTARWRYITREDDDTLFLETRKFMQELQQVAAKPSFMTNGNLKVCLAAHIVTESGRDVSLSHTEYSVLYSLMRKRGEVVSIKELMHLAWGDENYSSEQIVRVNVSRLRHRIEPNPKHPKYIITRKGFGYEMVDYEKQTDQLTNELATATI